MKKKITVFVLYDYPLFGLGLERLLRREKGIEIIGTAQRGPNILGQLKALCPDVIMLEGGESSDRLSPWEFLEEYLPQRVISITLDQNRLTVYTTHRILGAGVKDLVKAVTSGLTRRAQPDASQGDRSHEG